MNIYFGFLGMPVGGVGGVSRLWDNEQDGQSSEASRGQAIKGGTDK